MSAIRKHPKAWLAAGATVGRVVAVVDA